MAGVFMSQNLLPFASTYVHTLILVGYVLLIFVLCLVYPMLPVSLDLPFLIFPSVFSNVYLPYEEYNKYMNSILFRLYLQTWSNCINYRSVIDMIVDLSILIFAKNNSGLYNFAKTLTLRQSYLYCKLTVVRIN